MTNFTYEEWHYLWEAVEKRASQHWAFVEKFQIQNKESENDQTELWLHFLELAEIQTQLLNKIELIANEHCPITQQSLFPAKSNQTKTGKQQIKTQTKKSEKKSLDKSQKDQNTIYKDENENAANALHLENKLK